MAAEVYPTVRARAIGTAQAPREVVCSVRVRTGALSREELKAATELCVRVWAYDHLTQSLVHEKLFDDPAGELTAALAVRDDGTLLGLIGVCARGPTAWIKIAAADPAKRGRGIGCALLEQAEAWARSAGARTLRLMDHPGNYLTPGMDVRYAEAIEFFARRGYAVVGENTNLIVPLPPPPSARTPVQGYELRRARHADAAALAALARGFSEAWTHELARSMDRDLPAVHVALQRGEPVAFASHDGNNRGSGAFGPAGTLAEHRGIGLGQALLRACLLDIAKAGHPHAVIPWVSRTTLYARFGALPGGRYRVLAKSL
jgi:GNAT superfamily N-acetyltransferase